MKVRGNIQIPNIVVYAALYFTIFAISIWLLLAHEQSPANWLLYAAMIGSALAGLMKFAVYSWRRQRPRQTT
jgi:uncharacterized membrane protein